MFGSVKTTVRHYPDDNGITLVQVIDHGRVTFAADHDPVIAEVVAEARALDRRQRAGEDVQPLPRIDRAKIAKAEDTE